MTYFSSMRRKCSGVPRRRRSGPSVRNCGRAGTLLTASVIRRAFELGDTRRQRRYGVTAAEVLDGPDGVDLVPVVVGVVHPCAEHCHVLAALGQWEQLP